VPIHCLLGNILSPACSAPELLSAALAEGLLLKHFP